MKEKILVAFSGGRTSAYMCWWLIENMSDIYEFTFVYANTGLEHYKTLEFIKKVDEYLGLNLVWVEAKFNKRKGVGTSYNIVNFETCTRDGRLFDEMSSIYGIPNRIYIHCTRELKNIPIKKYAKDKIGVHRIALGIRHDEFLRVKNREDAIYPLATITKKTKKEILEWWEKQPFDLEISEHLGNCVGCYKKSDKKLKQIANEDPSYFDVFIGIERKYSHINTKSEFGERRIYRHSRTAYEVQNNLNLPKNLTLSDECPEECGSSESEEKSDFAYPSLFAHQRNTDDE